MGLELPIKTSNETFTMSTERQYKYIHGLPQGNLSSTSLANILTFGFNNTSHSLSNYFIRHHIKPS